MALSIFNGVFNVGQLIAVRLLSRTVRRRGADYTVCFAALGLMSCPLIMTLCSYLPLPWRMPVFTVLCTTLNAPQCAVNLCVIQILLRVAPKENRTLAVSLFTLSTTLTNSFMPVVGVQLYTFFGANHQGLVGSDAVATKCFFVNARVGFLTSDLLAEDDVVETIAESAALNLGVLYGDETIADNGDRVALRQGTNGLDSSGNGAEEIGGVAQVLLTHRYGHLCRFIHLRRTRCHHQGVEESVEFEVVLGDFVTTVTLPQLLIVGCIAGVVVFESIVITFQMVGLVYLIERTIGGSGEVAYRIVPIYQ